MTLCERATENDNRPGSCVRATKGHLRGMTKDFEGSLLTDCHSIFISSGSPAMSGGRETDMLVGYARTSPTDQEGGLEAQEPAPKATGVERPYSEQVSSVAERAQLEAALDFCRARDALVVSAWIGS